MTVSPGKISQLLGFMGLALASFLGCIDLTIVTMGLPVIAQNLKVTPAQSHMVLSVFLAALAMFMVTAGKMADQYGRKGVLLGGLGVFVLASMGAALADSLYELILSRFIQGLACAVLYTSTSTLVESLFSANQRAKAISRLYSVNGIGLAIGPVLGALILPIGGWPALFWINIPVGMIALILISLYVPRMVKNQGNNDYLGQILLAALVLGLMLLFQILPQYPWYSPKVLGILGVLLVGFVIAILVERAAKDPVIKLELFRNRQFRGAITSDFLLAFFYAGALLIIPEYLVSVAHYSISESGFFLVLVSVTMAVSSMQMGKIIESHGSAYILRWGFIGLLFSGLCIWIGVYLNHRIEFCLGLIIFGASWSAILNAATLQAMSAVPAYEVGFAVGASWTFHNLGGAIGAAMTSMLSGLYMGDSGNFYPVMLIMTVVLMVVSLLGIVQAIINSPRREERINSRL